MKKGGPIWGTARSALDEIKPPNSTSTTSPSNPERLDHVARVAERLRTGQLELFDHLPMQARKL